MNINNLLLLPALVNRAMDAARALKQGIHTIICWVEEATLTQLLDLPHFAVSGYSVETTSTQDILHLFCELTLEAGICLHCQTVSTTIKQYKERCVRDCDVWGKRTFLHFRTRRFECPDCGLRFTEEGVTLKSCTMIPCVICELQEPKTTHSVDITGSNDQQS